MEPMVKWGVWLAGTLGTFGWVEYQAIKNRAKRKADGKRSGTLTTTMRYWLGIEPPAKRRFVLAPVFGAFCFYLFTHFLFGWFMS